VTILDRARSGVEEDVTDDLGVTSFVRPPMRDHGDEEQALVLGVAVVSKTRHLRMDLIRRMMMRIWSETTARRLRTSLVGLAIVIVPSASAMAGDGRRGVNGGSTVHRSRVGSHQGRSHSGSYGSGWSRGVRRGGSRWGRYGRGYVSPAVPYVAPPNFLDPYYPFRQMNF
jgi:hypothetical protein